MLLALPTAMVLRKPGTLLPAFDTESVFNEAQSTHLWIVNRAAQLTGNSVIMDLVQPGMGQNNEYPFHNNLCQGLYDADFLANYNGPFIWGQASYASHFYDPDTGQNWLQASSMEVYQASEMSTWTALTQGESFFWQSVDAYKNSGDLAAAGYNLGLCLHYFTDMMQPMHAANFTYQDSSFYGYHTAFETFVMENQDTYAVQRSLPTRYIASDLPPFPSEYIISGAVNSKSKYYDAICPPLIVADYSWLYGMTPQQQDLIRPYIGPILADAIALTAQYLTLWASIATAPLSNSVLVSAISGMVIDVPGGTQAPGTQLQQYTWNDGSNQTYSLSPVPNSEDIFYILPNSASGLVLEVEYEGPTANNTPVLQNTYSQGTTSQQWRLVQIDEVSVAFQNVASGLFLTVSPPLSQARSKLVQSLQNTSGAQQWHIVQAATTTQMLLAANNGLAIDVYGSSPNFGTPVVIWSSNSTPAQIFLWVALGGDDIGYSMILNQASGLVISAGSGLVVTDLWDSSDSEKWRTVPVVEGSSAFYIQVKSSGFYLRYWGGQGANSLTLTPELTIASAFTFQSVSSASLVGISRGQNATVAAAANATS